MNLVLFTAHYPYGNGEPFLEDELRAAERVFARITIITYAKPGEPLTRYVPANAEVIALRRERSAAQERRSLIAAAFRPRVWREIASGIRERGARSAAAVLKKTLLCERHVRSIERALSDRPGLRERETVWYSYWLNAAGQYLSAHRGELSGVCIARAHGGDCFFDRGYVPGRAQMLRRLDGVFPISESGRADLLAHYGAAAPGLADKIQTMRLGVPLPEPGPTSADTDRAFTIVTCSNVIPLKRLDLLIDALALISDLAIRWVHFGDGQQMDEIRALAAKKLDGRDNIRYTFRGRMPKEDIMRFYAAEPVDLFVNCSDVEGIPVSAMEAMSCGIPVAARDVGGLSELVDDACGRLLPRTITAAELADAIRSVLLSADGVPVSARRASARARIVQDYCAQKNYEVYFNEIRRMCLEAWSSKA